MDRQKRLSCEEKKEIRRRGVTNITYAYRIFDEQFDTIKEGRFICCHFIGIDFEKMDIRENFFFECIFENCRLDGRMVRPGSILK